MGLLRGLILILFRANLQPARKVIKCDVKRIFDNITFSSGALQDCRLNFHYMVFWIINHTTKNFLRHPDVS